MVFTYYHKLKIENHPELLEEISNSIHELYPLFCNLINSYIDDDTGEYIIPSGYQDNIIKIMKKISIQRPSLIFHIYSINESGEFELIYLQNGKQYIQPATITYKKFDPRKLR